MTLVLFLKLVIKNMLVALEGENGGGGDLGGEDGGDDGNSGSIGDIAKPDAGIDVSNLKFDISGSEIKGYVTVSFTDNGKRNAGESGVIYKNALGVIIKEARVPFKSRDTVASVTIRLIKALHMKASYTGTETSNFYLDSIGNFTLNGKKYATFGEFDAGAASGWMVKHNSWFINMGASEFSVSDGDTVEWLYTCRLGADIGCDWSNPSAEITGIKFKSDYGTLSPSFGKEITEYIYSVSSSTKSIALKAEQENYWAKVTYTSGGKTYKPMESIPVSDGTVIKVSSAFAEHAGNTPSDTDSIEITIKKNGGGTNSGSGSLLKGNSESESDETQGKTVFNGKTFSDVKEADWYYKSVKYTYENNLMEGTGKGFEPESKMSRAMLVTVLYRMAKPGTCEKKHSFSDVPEGQWYTDAIAWAAENDIIRGISKTEFAPDKEVSREQMALILYRFAKSEGYDVSDMADISKFTDTKDVSDYALNAVRWANQSGLINGISETTLSPKTTATRAEVATILMRFCENTAKNAAL